MTPLTRLREQQSWLLQQRVHYPKRRAWVQQHAHLQERLQAAQAAQNLTLEVIVGAELGALLATSSRIPLSVEDFEKLPTRRLRVIAKLEALCEELSAVEDDDASLQQATALLRSLRKVDFEAL
jgi:hypothetical protein